MTRPRIEDIEVPGSADVDDVPSVDADGYLKFKPPGGGTPTGSAGGDLAGTYPNPTIGSAGMEAIRDMLASVITAGAGISVTVNDAGDTITVTSTVSAYTDEQVRDVMGAALVAGPGISIAVNDAGDTITITATGAVAASTLTTRYQPLVMVTAGVPELVYDSDNNLVMVEVPNP